MIRAFLLGIVATIAVAAAIGLAIVMFGLIPSSADQKPSRMERWAARRALNATIARESVNVRDPLPLTDENLAAGVKLYASNCVYCHGAADEKPSTSAKGLYIRAPQLAKDGVEDDPEAESYWKISHGIRFTAMPAVGKTLSDEQRWQITQFVAHMDKLPSPVDAEWKKVPSAAPRS
jgi:mono/diheme cytochrome c family protein